MILPRQEDRGIVVFWILPGLAYRVRLAASLSLIVAGFVVQLATGTLLPGVAGVALGNLLLLTRGYHNRVSAKAFDPDANWQSVDEGRLVELETLHEKMRHWDRSALDISNPMGVVGFLIVAVPLALGIATLPGMGRVLAIDAAVLLVPYWVTGTRRILTRPKLMVQIRAIREVLDTTRRQLRDHRLVTLMLMSGGETPLPEDLKLRVDIAGRHEDFLGLYGQAVINDVQGTSYPYFYAVLVAKRGFGLDAVHRTYQPRGNWVTEFDRKKEVEVLVIRQRTTKNSGYHTDRWAAVAIFLEGLKLAEKTAVRAPA